MTAPSTGLGALATAIAALLTETSLTLPDVAELTDRQIFDLYYHPRDREGKVVSNHLNQLPDSSDNLTVEDAARIHFSVGAGLGITREKLEAAWLEKHATIPEGV